MHAVDDRGLRSIEVLRTTDATIRCLAKAPSKTLAQLPPVWSRILSKRRRCDGGQEFYSEREQESYWLSSWARAFLSFVRLDATREKSVLLA